MFKARLCLVLGVFLYACCSAFLRLLQLYVENAGHMPVF